MQFIDICKAVMTLQPFDWKSEVVACLLVKKLNNITNVNFIWPRQLINSCEEVTNVNKLNGLNFNAVLSVCL